MKLKIEKIERENKTSKAGKPYIALKVIANGGVWFTGFGNESNQNWREGQEIDTPVYTEQYQDKTYYKLGLPKNPTEGQMIMSRLDEIVSMLRAMKYEKKLEIPKELEGTGLEFLTQ
jgi:hypothetical protein